VAATQTKAILKKLPPFTLAGFDLTTNIRRETNDKVVQFQPPPQPQQRNIVLMNR
jgi:hypothetical protein